MAVDGRPPSFDLLRASVNLFVASALVSFATSLKLPLSTTYVTFMVAMGSSLSDQAWGRESAVYRVTGVLTVISGWFLTAFVAFSISLVFAFAIYYAHLPAVLGLIVLLVGLVLHSYRLHFQREKDSAAIEALGRQDFSDKASAINASFDQTGHFLKEIGDSLNFCFDAAFTEDRQKLRDASTWTDKIQKSANIIIANIFETLFLLRSDSVDSSQQYAKTIRYIQGIAESHRDMIKRAYVHFDNCHEGFSQDQKEELRRAKAYLCRLLWNASIMLQRRKKVDYDYIASQCRRFGDLAVSVDKKQVQRIQTGEAKTRLTMLYYAFLENTLNIAEQTKSMLDVFRVSFGK